MPVGKEERVGSRGTRDTDGGKRIAIELTVSIASLAMLLIGGVWYFRRVERIFADRI